MVGYYPTRLFWDVNHARLLVCEARRAQSEHSLEQNGAAGSEVVLMIVITLILSILTHKSFTYLLFVTVFCSCYF